jgi:hypothetical protein
VLFPSRSPGALRRKRLFFDYFDLELSPVRVVLALRDDYVFALNRWRRHLPRLGENYFELRALRGPAAFEAVYKPGCLRSHKRQVNGTLVDTDTGQPPIVTEATARRIVRFIAERKADVPLEEIEAVPPILSLLCRELNERRYPQGADNSGSPMAEVVFDEEQTNVETILETFYERCLAGRPEAVRIFIEEDLVSHSGIRLQNDERSMVDVFTNGCEIPGDEMARHAAGYGKRETATDCLRDLVNERLLSPAEGGENPRYELTHDLLCRVVYKSRTARQQRLEKERLERRAREQVKAKEDAERRAEQEKRAKEEAEARTRVERELRKEQEARAIEAEKAQRLEAERAAEAEEFARAQKKAASKFRRLAWILALVALTAIAAATFGLLQRAGAKREAMRAMTAERSANEQRGHAERETIRAKELTEEARKAKDEASEAASQANVSVARYLHDANKMIRRWRISRRHCARVRKTLEP